MNMRCNRWWILWVAGFGVLTLIYLHVFVMEPVNSDTANALLAAQDIAAGNWRLHGWFMAPDNYLGLDETLYALIWSLTGKAFLTLRLVPAIQWAGLMVLACYLGMRAEAPLQSLAILAALLVVPVFTPFTAHVYFQAPFHIPTTICMLLTVMLCDRLLKAGRLEWKWAGPLALITVNAAFSDPFFQFTLTFPLLFALWGSRAAVYQRIALLYLLCVACGMLLVHMNAATGGFTLPYTNLPRLAAVQYIALEIKGTTLMWLGLLGCIPFEQPFWLAIYAVMRAVLILFLFYRALRLVRRIHALEFIDLCLLLIIGGNIGELIFTKSISFLLTQRFLLPAWVCCAILAAKLARKDKVVAGYCVILASLAFAVCLVNLARAPGASIRFSPGETSYITALEAKGLFHGYAEYWQASDTTVATNGKIDIAAIHLVKDRKLEAYDWFAKQSWYDGGAANRPFFVSVSGNLLRLQPGAVFTTFGKPDEIFTTPGAAYFPGSDQGDLITYVYNRPQPALGLSK